VILQELYKLAQRKKLLEDTAFTDRSVHFVVRIDREGKFVSLEPTLDERNNGLRTLAPKPPVRSSGVAPAFLVDNAQYTLRFAKDGKEKNAAERAAEFDALVAEAADATNDEGLRVLQRFLGRRDEFREAIQSAAPTVPGKKGAPPKSWDWNADPVIAFALAGEVDRIDERDEVAAWWRARVAAQAMSGTQTARCLVTGEIGPQFLEPHSKLKGVPEGQTIGTALISYNADAFKTFGLADTDPISHAGAEGYVRALNWLLEREGDRRFRQGVLLDPGTVVLFWTREENQVVDALSLLGASFFEQPAAETGGAKRGRKVASTPDELRKTIEGPWKGIPQESTDPTAFFALTLSGNAARAVVRDWMTSTAGEIKAHLARWFEDLAIAGGEGLPRPLRVVMEALQAFPDATENKGDLPPDLATRLFRCALTGAPLPRTVLARAVQRFRHVDAEGRWRRLIYRAAVIRCALNRDRRVRGEKEITVALDPDNHDVGYVLGRLFSLLEQMQLRASGRGNDLNASIRDRFFGAASSTPGVVFPRLLALSVHHASKLAKDGDNWLERQKGEVLALLPAARFPATLDLDGQGLFALGYYHQQQSRFRPKGAAEGSGKALTEGENP
jgi:CRISPR-associated protein Csd1